MNKIRFLPLVLFMIFLNGCSAFGWLKFWDSEEEEEGPAELFAINESVKIYTDWAESFGNENNFIPKESILCHWCYLWEECTAKVGPNPVKRAD